MRRIGTFVSTGAVLLAALTACGGGAPRSPAGPVAAATIAPLADLVARVAGDGWRVVTLVPPGTSPHVFEPTARQVRDFAPARLVVSAGAGYDAWVSGLAAACGSRAERLDLGEAVGVRLEAKDSHEHGAAGHVHGGVGEDPHWWLDPAWARRSVPAIAMTLSTLDPAGARGYAERAATVDEALGVLDAEIEALLRPVRGEGILTAHNAWVYFAARYGLRIVGAVEPIPGREPSPRELAALLETARREGIRTLFTEPQFPPGAARVIAGEAGLEIALVDPIGGVPGRSGYAELMRENARVFRDGLRPR